MPFRLGQPSAKTTGRILFASPVTLRPFLAVVATFVVSVCVEGHELRIQNNCGELLHIGIRGDPWDQSQESISLDLGEERSIDVPEGWKSGSIWALTGCDSQGNNCETGGSIGSTPYYPVPPVTQAEISFQAYAGLDFYDVSLVSGFNVPVSMFPIEGSVSPRGGEFDCSVAGCQADLNSFCPSELQSVGRDNLIVGCNSGCDALNTDEHCCRDIFSTPEVCLPTEESIFFKNLCPYAYSYAFDDASSTFTCSGNNAGSSGYHIVFCPGSGSPAPVAPQDLASRCGNCPSCATSVTSKDAGGHQVGDRIDWLKNNQGKSEEEACTQVCGGEYPEICGVECNPEVCNIGPAPTSIPSITSGPAPTPTPPIASAFPVLVRNKICANELCPDMDPTQPVKLFVGYSQYSLGCEDGSNEFEVAYDPVAMVNGIGLQDNAWFWRPDTSNNEGKQNPDNAGMQVFVTSACETRTAASVHDNGPPPDMRDLVSVLGSIEDGKCVVTLRRTSHGCVAGEGKNQCHGPCSFFSSDIFCNDPDTTYPQQTCTNEPVTGGPTKSPTISTPGSPTKCGAAVNWDCANKLWLPTDDESMHCYGYGGPQDPCSLHNNNDDNDGLTKDPSFCDGDTFFLWDEPDTQGESYSWAGRQWATYASTYESAIMTMRQRGVKFTSPLLRAGGTGILAQNLNEFYDSCGPACRDQNSPAYIDVIAINAFCGSWNGEGEEGCRAAASFIVREIASLSNGRPVYVTNWSRLSTYDPLDQVDAMNAVDEFFVDGSFIDRVYWFGATDYGGNSGGSLLTTVLGNGKVLGQVWKEKCDILNTPLNPEPAPSPSSISPTTNPTTGPEPTPSPSPSSISPTTNPTTGPEPTPSPSSGSPTTNPTTGPEPTPSPSSGSPTTNPTTGPLLPKCGCSACTTTVLERDAEGSKVGGRIDWVVANMQKSESDACTLVCGTEYPFICAECDPLKCSDPDISTPTKSPTKSSSSGPVHVERVTIVNKCPRPVFVYGTQDGRENIHAFGAGDVRRFEPDAIQTFPASDAVTWVPWHGQRLETAFFEQPANQRPINGHSLVFEMNSDNWSHNIPANSHWSWVVQIGYPAGLNMMVEIFTDPDTLLCDGSGNEGTNIGRARTNFAADACDKLSFGEKEIATVGGESFDICKPICPTEAINGICPTSCFHDGMLIDYAAYHSQQSEAWKDGEWTKSMASGPENNQRCVPREGPVGLDLDVNTCAPSEFPWAVSFECWDNQAGPQGWPILSNNSCRWPSSIYEIQVTLCDEDEGQPPPLTPAPTESPPSTTPTKDPTAGPLPKCGCSSCTPSVLDRDANGHSVRGRIDWVVATMQKSESDACNLVCGTEFPDVCAECDSGTCPTAARARRSSRRLGRTQRETRLG